MGCCRLAICAPLAGATSAGVSTVALPVGAAGLWAQEIASAAAAPTTIVLMTLRIRNLFINTSLHVLTRIAPRSSLPYLPPTPCRGTAKPRIPTRSLHVNGHRLSDGPTP